MKQKKCLRYWLMLELLYQLYLRIHWVNFPNEYDWEGYAVVRNKASIETIHDYFKSNSQDSNFVYAVNPNEGTADLSTLPTAVQRAIYRLQWDLLSGLHWGQRKMFSVEYHKREKNEYTIDIHAGATFHSNYNGYQFSLYLTNNSTGQYLLQEEVLFPSIYVNRRVNQKDRFFPIILSYNCNRYDLLVWKLIDMGVMVWREFKIK